MANKVFKYYKTLSLLLGALLCLALPPYNFFVAALVVFPLFFTLVLQTDCAKKAALCGYLFGFGFFGFGFCWIGNALLIDALHTGWLYPIVLLLNGAFFGIFSIAPAFVVKLLKLNTLFSKILAFGCAWGISMEWIRSWFFTGFPWNPLSSVLIFDEKMVQILSLCGTYACSMLLACILVLPALWWLQKSKICAVIGCVIYAAFFALSYAYGDAVLPKNYDELQNIRVRLVQPSLKQTAQRGYERAINELYSHIDLSLSAPNEDVDFVVWGETTSAFDLRYEADLLQVVAKVVPQNGHLISGMLRREYTDGYDYKLYNSLVVIDENGSILDSYDKNHLVPFGEYIPFRRFLPDFVHPLTNMVAEFGRGEKYKTIRVGKYAEFAPLICYEIIFSGNIVRKTGKPKWMVLLTYDGWYGESSGPYQHLVAAQMRAIEEGISIVRSANSGISAVISPYGQVLAKIGLNQKGILDADVPLALAHDTLFGKYGNTLFYLLATALLVLSLIFRKPLTHCKK